MKKTNTILKYYKRLTKKINKKLKKSPDKYNEEDYHKLRVSIKKLKSLLFLAEFCCKDFRIKKYFKPVKRVFKQSGSVREFQLEDLTLRKYKQYSIKCYLSDLELKIKDEEQKFNSLINKKFRKKIKKSFKKIYPFINEMHAAEVQAFMVKETNELNDLFQQKFLDPMHVHELRKKLKVDFYNREALNLPGQNNLKEENDFQELLGKWHDSRIMNDHLENSIVKEVIDPIELKQILRIDTEILSESENLLIEINSKIEINGLH